MSDPPPERRRGRQRWRHWGLRAIGPALLAVVLLRLGTRETLEAIGQAAAVPLVAAYLLFLPSLAFRSLRWQDVIR